MITKGVHRPLHIPEITKYRRFEITKYKSPALEPDEIDTIQAHIEIAMWPEMMSPEEFEAMEGADKDFWRFKDEFIARFPEDKDAKALLFDIHANRYCTVSWSTIFFMFLFSTGWSPITFCSKTICSQKTLNSADNQECRSTWIKSKRHCTPCLSPFCTILNKNMFLFRHYKNTARHSKKDIKSWDEMLDTLQYVLEAQCQECMRIDKAISVRQDRQRIQRDAEKEFKDLLKELRHDLQDELDEHIKKAHGDGSHTWMKTVKTISTKQNAEHPELNGIMKIQKSDTTIIKRSDMFFCLFSTQSMCLR